MKKFLTTQKENFFKKRRKKKKSLRQTCDISNAFRSVLHGFLLYAMASFAVLCCITSQVWSFEGGWVYHRYLENHMLLQAL